VENTDFEHNKHAPARGTDFENVKILMDRRGKFSVPFPAVTDVDECPLAPSLFEVEAAYI
jgi:hypothetical protein